MPSWEASAVHTPSSAEAVRGWGGAKRGGAEAAGRGGTGTEADTEASGPLASGRPASSGACREPLNAASEGMEVVATRGTEGRSGAGAEHATKVASVSHAAPRGIIDGEATRHPPTSGEDDPTVGRRYLLSATSICSRTSAFESPCSLNVTLRFLSKNALGAV